MMLNRRHKIPLWRCYNWKFVWQDLRWVVYLLILALVWGTLMHFIGAYYEAQENAEENAKKISMMLNGEWQGYSILESGEYVAIRLKVEEWNIGIPQKREEAVPLSLVNEVVPII